LVSETSGYLNNKAVWYTNGCRFPHYRGPQMDNTPWQWCGIQRGSLINKTQIREGKET